MIPFHAFHQFQLSIYMRKGNALNIGKLSWSISPGTQFSLWKSGVLEFFLNTLCFFVTRFFNRVREFMGMQEHFCEKVKSMCLKRGAYFSVLFTFFTFYIHLDFALISTFCIRLIWILCEVVQCTKQIRYLLTNIKNLEKNTFSLWSESK